MATLAGFEEYLFTIGILIAFLGTAVSAALSRRQIAGALRWARLRRWHIAAMLAILALFVVAQLAIVKPTQQLFFDDAIYQGGALDLLRMGQAWMCNYGTTLTCLSGQVFHEPIGTSFTLAIGFALFGVHLATTYNTMLVVSAIAVVMAFLVGTLLLRDPVAGLFTELLVALSPIVMVWARPTTSDMPMMAYSLIAVFFMLVFLRRKSVVTFSAALLSLALVSYMKVDAVLYAPVILAMYLVLDSTGIRASLAGNLRAVRRNLLNTRVLVIVLVFALALAPEVAYSYVELATGNYGYQGTSVQLSCVPGFSAIHPNASISLQNFNANVCANLAFWFDSFKSSDIMQPMIFTLLGVFGAAAMMARKRRELLAVGIWFIAFFFLYTAFYAGGVTYGVDWRFMLALIVPASLLGGYAASLSYLGRPGRRRKTAWKVARGAAYVIVLFIIFYPLFALEPLLGIAPSQISQAGDARFYEGFVYNESHAIPSSCLVFSYDPTLFNINNRTSIQMFDLYPQSYQSYRSQYSCLVLDYGYWCYTPGNTCTYIESAFNLSSLATATYSKEGKLYGFFLITGVKNSTK